MSPAAETAENAPEPRRPRWGLWLGVVSIVLLVLLACGVAWILNTSSGARWAASMAVRVLAGKLEVGAVRGTIAGPLTVQSLRYHDDTRGVDVRVASATVDIALLELRRRRVHVKAFDATGVDVRLSQREREEKEQEPQRERSLAPPIDIVLDEFAMKDGRLSRDGKELLAARSAQVAGSWTREALVIRKLDLSSPDGSVQVRGNVSDRGNYVGRAEGAFRWRVGERSYAGELSAVSEQQQLSLQLRMSAPFGARLDAKLEETDELPWEFTLDVPSFDAREQLLKGRAIEQLAASLTGKGHRTLAEVHGQVSINGQNLGIELLRAHYEEQVLHLEPLTLVDPTGHGTLSATGELRFGEAARAASQSPQALDRRVPPLPLPADADAVPAAPRADTAGDDEALAGETAPAPFFADLHASWKGVQLPQEWVGQPLATHGGVRVTGTPERFRADGQLSLGPPGRLSDIALAVAGTPERIEISQLSVKDTGGNLTAKGVVQLKPAIGWQFAARASQFDPGQFVARWPGRLGFNLETNGTLTEAGPNASLNLHELEGTLRGRTLEGQGTLSVNPERIVAGDLRLRSGKSQLTVNGRSGAAMDLDANLDIASLDDWVPDSAGRVRGQFHVSGVWPDLRIEGNAQGRALAYGEYSAKTLRVVADVRNPRAPTGTLSVTANGILAAGFAFSRTQLDASGDQAAHTVHLAAKGQPVSTEIRVQGAREGESWSGSVDQLSVAVVGLSPLALREPVRIAWSPASFSVSQTCLEGDQISACAAATQDEAGELNASYRLEHLPLGLIVALAAPNLPVHIEAVIEGDGTIRRTPEGALFGKARVSSPSGRVSQMTEPAQEDAGDVLLTYADFQLTAELAGDTAQGSLHSTINDSGRVEGQLALSGLGGPAPAMNGGAKLAMPDLSPVELFVPQLADVGGNAEATVTASGTLTNPEITGNVTLRQLTAEVPQVGIRLQDGELHGSLTPGREIMLEGRIRSGDGEITLDGRTNDAGVLDVSVQGKEFLAANIPGARVIVAPDMNFVRTSEKMTLGGTVTIPRADVDLSKLPRSGAHAQSASPDVVVIDDKEDVAARSRRVPLEVRVNVVLGDSVKLAGFGLDAQVQGKLQVVELPDEPTTANGELRVSGTYKAYGQDLTIEQGRILFAGQEITDPQLNLVATRKVDTVTAKLMVTGSAQKPLLEVSSDPPMAQTQALSYLVTGKPLSEVGQREGDLMQSAARSLGGAAGNLLAKGLGRRLGIDQIGIEDNAAVGGSAFTVGQYLSPRLYLSYGVGLFEPGQVVTVRYRISDRLALEAVQGTLSQRAGINWRLER
ncbi:MAG: translocation/assembly module TamB domain-containing protein [Steroidobacteraceae bacterium]|nr:translocation/assembly module TamB domain-containing protein [Steroidobacteraceae bacterium]